MDITALSMNMSQTQVQQDASIRVQKLAMDGAKTEGAAIVGMMNASTVITDPALGNRIDFLA